MRKSLLLLFSMLSFGLSYGQIQISGVILENQTNEPVIGASVVEKGTVNGVAADIDGKFIITVESNATLVFSYVGMQSHEQKVGDKNTSLTIYLKNEGTLLDEFVVVGYGVTRKRDLAGAITSLKTDDIKAGVVTDMSQMLKGRAAGVQVKQNSLEPGGSISIRVRGASSVSSNNEPLYVVDGFPVDGTSYLNPADIESLEILKDASTASIYGARGANGVVLITTKKGKENQYTVDYSYNLSSKVLKNPWMLSDAEDIIQQGNQRWIDNGSAGNPPYSVEHLAYRGKGYDWVDLATRNSTTQDHQVSIMGGNDRMKMYIAGSYMEDAGILRGTDYTRFTGRMNLDFNLTKSVRFGSSMVFSQSEKNYLDMGKTASTSNIMYKMFMQSPLVGPDGIDVVGKQERKPSLLQEINELDKKNTSSNFYASIYGEIDLLEGLTAKIQYNFNHSDSKMQNYYPQSTTLGAGDKGNAFTYNERGDNSHLDVFLTYNKSFNEDNVFKAILGTSYSNSTIESNEMQATGFASDLLGYHDMGGGERISYISSGRSENERQSFFSRLEYIFKNKYIFNGTFRTDGSAVFGKNNKWGYFPSGSLAWQLGDEPFMEFTKPLFYEIKLRTGYGLVGNDGIGRYRSIAKFAIGNVYLGGTDLQKAMYMGNPNNKDLKWESTSQFNIGTDFSFLNKKIEVNFDYYYKKTTDLLNPKAVSSSTQGFVNMFANNGEIENKGFELLIRSTNFAKSKFSWETTLNLSRNKNKVLKLNEGESRYETIRPHGSYSFQEYSLLKEGEPLSALYGYVFDGIIQQGETYTPQPNAVPGDPKFVDLDGDGLITDKDRKVIGDGNPDIIIGLGNNFSYRDFDFSFFFESSLGGKLLNLTRIVLEDEGRLKEGLYDRWTQKNPSNRVPRNGYKRDAGVQYGSYISSRYIESASYLRLQNVEVGYNVPVKKMKSLSNVVKGLRVFVGAQNLFTITNYTGFDPDVSTNGGNSTSQGLDFSSYPAYRQFNVGAKITF